MKKVYNKMSTKADLRRKIGIIMSDKEELEEQMDADEEDSNEGCNELARGKRPRRATGRREEAGSDEDEEGAGVESEDNEEVDVKLRRKKKRTADEYYLLRKYGVCGKDGQLRELCSLPVELQSSELQSSS